VISAELQRSAIARLADDGFVAYPTETVWGLGACADRPRAVDRLLAWKGRSGDSPMAVLVGSAEEVEAWGCRLELPARRLIDAFWPGPLTIVLDCDRRFAPGVAGPGGAVGLRSSPHPIARALSCAVREAGLGPLTATSFNRSGQPAAADRAEARSWLGACDAADPDQPLLVDDPECDAGGGAPSSVVDCSRRIPEVLRVGAIDRDRLEAVWSDRDHPMDPGSKQR